MKTEEPPQVCQFCGTDLMHPGMEVTLKRVAAGFISATGRKANRTGTLYLTNTRLFFLSDAGQTTAYAIGGLIGVAIAAGVAKAQGTINALVFSIPLEDIHTLEDSKVALAKTITIITYGGGEIGKVAPPRRDEWTAAIMGAKQARR